MTQFAREPENAVATDAGLGRRLQLTHAAQWLHATADDPYARLSLGFDDDPYPLFQHLRSRGPLWRSETGAWVTARHGPAAELLRHPDLVMWRIADLPAGSGRPLLGTGSGDIERICRIAGPALAAAADRDRIRLACDRLLDGISGEFDAVADVAERLPVEVLADLLGLYGPTQRVQLAADCAAAAPALDSALCPQQLVVSRRMLKAIDSLRALLAAASANQTTGTPGDGPAGLFAAATSKSAADTEELGVLLAVAGVRVAASLITSAVAALVQHPDWYRPAASNPDWARQVLDETLRHDPPVQLYAMMARSDLRVADQLVPAGSQVVVAIGAANRDPDAFADPDTFDPGRRARPGHEPLTAPPLHALAGPLAFTEAEIVLRALAARFPGLRPGSPAARHRRAPVTRRLARLPVSSGCAGTR